MKHCPSLYSAQRRITRTVEVGSVGIGGAHPVRVQSMLTCDTMDTAACIKQTLELVEVGCELVRITAPTVKDAANLEHIAAGLRSHGCRVPLVADIHFKPEAALEAAKWVEKVRINPGNYADKKRFDVREYTEEQYCAELERIRERFLPLLELCKANGTAMRIGTNHGSLSDRIMNRYGDSPLGMVESALEFARIARDCGYHAFVFSMKASNPKVMIAAYRLLVARLDTLGPDWNYPVHLGVTEAGDGEDGRIKSAIGIGSLLADGIGDTVRVSLTEDSVHEIPVAQALASRVALSIEPEANQDHPIDSAAAFDPFQYRRRDTSTIKAEGFLLGGNELLRVVLPELLHRSILEGRNAGTPLGEYQPELVAERLKVIEVDPKDEASIEEINNTPLPQLVTVADHVEMAPIHAFRLLASRVNPRHPILLKDSLDPMQKPDSALDALLASSVVLGSLICDGIGDAILLRNETAPGAALRLSYNILQASGARLFKTDYVACPSCGRTLFNLQETTARIKEATAHLKGVKIAIMGCIVNGPGEMADADFGYVGGAPHKINLYVGKKAVKFNIPEEEAVDRLRELITEHGKWVDPSEVKL
ncbi:MAG: (E)-4-hydroxy-3-methylbut-2-enyl-diphosphate synthase [Verrucomicrobiota bacterium]